VAAKFQLRITQPSIVLLSEPARCSQQTYHRPDHLDDRISGRAAADDRVCNAISAWCAIVRFGRWSVWYEWNASSWFNWRQL